MSDIADFLDQRPAQAVQLDSSETIAQTGRWITSKGTICSWVAAKGSEALGRVGDGANRLWFFDREGMRSPTATIGDWVVRQQDGSFRVMEDDEFRKVFVPVRSIPFSGQLEIEETDE